MTSPMRTMRRKSSRFCTPKSAHTSSANMVGITTGSPSIGDIERLLIDVAKGKTAPSKLTKAERKAGRVVHGGPGVAAQCVTLAGTIFAFAIRRGVRADNPAHGIKKPAVKKMNRFLSEVEIARLASALDAESASTGRPYPAAAIKVLLLTGCRKSEILNLRWDRRRF